MQRIFIAAIVVGAPLLMAAECGGDAPTADDRQTQQQTQAVTEADREVGLPAITNWSEKRQVKDLYELRDKMLPTWTYMQGIDGRLICMGQSIGYGIPYSVEFSNPHKIVNNRYDSGNHSNYDGPVDQEEPNGLFMPSTAEGTWVQMLDPTTRKISPVYVEPRVTVSPFRLSGPIIAKDCS